MFAGYRFERLREDAELVMSRGHPLEGGPPILIAAAARAASPGLETRFRHELALAPDLVGLPALQPMTKAEIEGRAALAFNDPGGTPLDSEMQRPLGLSRFLNLAIGIAGALREVHEHGLVHRDIRPANIIVDDDGKVRLTGFGLASRLVRERRTAERPEVIAAALGYMAPEQSGRLNRSIDHRSDLYSVGITFYEMLVGALPFTAAAPMEWIHCHVARLPPPPSVRVEGIPDVVERIILKLLEKNAEDRYQTAAGLQHDLQLCLDRLNSGAWDEPFELAERDVPDRFVPPEKLYGREGDVRALVDAFDTISSHPTFDIVLVSGEPGIGKSSVVGELRRAVYAVGGLFASGKFDQFKRNVPYATLAEAFRGLFRHLLGLDDDSLASWRKALQDALGGGAQVMVDLFPELALIIGDQPPVPAVSPQEGKNRFNLLFMRLVSVFASADHPLVLFLDDLQWIDGATLDLIELMSGEEQVPHLLLLGAYRTSEVGDGHELNQLVERLAAARGGVQDVRLQPLRTADVAELIEDSLRAPADRSGALAELAIEKARGNPFFTVQFLTTLSAEGLIRFNAAAGAWDWDLEAIRDQALTDNVAGLLAKRIGRYPKRARDVAALLACVGENADSSTFASLLGVPEVQVEDAMRDLVRDGFVQRVNRSYGFTHDGVREAAYNLVPKRERPRLHLAVGRLLRDRTGPEDLDERIFAIVDHLNRARDLITEPGEKLRLAEINLVAGRRSRAGTAYEAAVSHLEAALELIARSRGSNAVRLRFDVEFDLAEAEFMTGRIEAAERRLERLANRSRSTADLVRVVGRQLAIYNYLGQFEHAVALSIRCLAAMGVLLPVQPTDRDIQAAYATLCEHLHGREIEDLIDLPRMTDERQLEIAGALADLFIPAGAVNTELHYLAGLTLVNLTLEHGIANESVAGFALLGAQLLGWRLGTFADGKRFAKLAMRLVEEKGLDRYASRIYAVISGTIGPWSRPLSECYAIAVRATEIGREQGGITYSGYAWGCALTALLDGGRSLAEVERQAEASLAIMARLKFPLVVDFMTVQLMLARALRGATSSPLSFSSAEFDEQAYEERLGSAAHLWHALVRYRIRKLQLHLIGGDIHSCLELLQWLDGEVDKLKVFELAEYHFYAALARASALQEAARDGRDMGTAREALERSHAKLVEWSGLCAENFASRATLVAAEIAVLDGRYAEAWELHEQAMRLAAEQGFQHIEALAAELAARAYASRGLETAAAAYLDLARRCYERWGATAKAMQIQRQLPLAHSTDEATLEPEMRQLDLAAAVTMYQSLSREIVLDRLIEQLMTTVIEHAGATRSLLLLSREGRLRIVAEAATSGDEVVVRSRKPAHFAGELPESVLHYVARTREVIIIDDAIAANAHSGDPYILRARPRSILCLPLVKQGRLVGVLYLENGLASYSFPQDRVDVLQLVASQAAISIENAELFLDVQRKQQEVRQAGDEVRRSFDMIPALAWSASADGLIEFSNKQWHDFTGIPEADARGKTWIRAFHPDDVGKVSSKWRRLLKFRSSGEFEARMERFDGTERRFLIRLTPMCDARGEIIKWHGTHTDIDDLKRAEEAQEALARASRVTAMGALTVSIAHEINQPLMAIVTNAATCMRWLEADTPDVAEARLAAERVIRDGHRAGDVIASIRAMARKAGREGAELDVDELVREVLQLTRNELERHAIRVNTSFGAAVYPVIGDRTQIQQVLLNLVLNGIEAIAAAPGDQRSIEISTGAGDPGFTTVSVADSGIGLDIAEPSRIFDAFYTTKSEGVGIGLSICRSIIESHGGRIWAAPRIPRGSVFRFSLPHIEEVHAQ